MIMEYNVNFVIVKCTVLCGTQSFNIDLPF